MAQNNQSVRDIIRRLVQEVLEENSDCEDCGSEEEHNCADHEGQSHEEWQEAQDAVQEMTTTGDVEGYQTPFAFDDEDEEGHARSIKSKAEVFDFKSTKNEKGNTVQLEEGKSLYHVFRDNPDMKPTQKIGVAMRHINKMLTEVEKLVRVSSRFKNETDVTSSSYWKTTNRYLMKLDDKLQRISDKVREIK